MTDLLKFSPEEESSCGGGLFFKAERSQYMNSRGLHEKVSLRFLKRKSCNCPKCQQLLEGMEEEISMAGPEAFDLSEIENGAVYAVRAIWHEGPHEYPLDGDLEWVFIRC